VSVYTSDPEQRRMLARLLELGVVAETEVDAPVEGPLTGSSFCVTGALSEPREAVHARIRAGGGDVHTTVRKGTTYLVAGDKVGKAKLDAAQKKGAQIIDEDKLRELLAG
jgi:DNA ligase (NAD+)